MPSRRTPVSSALLRPTAPSRPRVLLPGGHWPESTSAGSHQAAEPEPRVRGLFVSPAEPLPRFRLHPEAARHEEVTAMQNRQFPIGLDGREFGEVDQLLTLAGI